MSRGRNGKWLDWCRTEGHPSTCANESCPDALIDRTQPERTPKRDKKKRGRRS